jgi:hypothetical protein
MLEKQAGIRSFASTTENYHPGLNGPEERSALRTHTALTVAACS